MANNETFEVLRDNKWLTLSPSELQVGDSMWLETVPYDHFGAHATGWAIWNGEEWEEEYDYSTYNYQ